MKVSKAEFLQNCGALADRAMTEPVTITEDGLARFVMISAAEYARLEGRARRVVRLEAFTEQEIALIGSSEVPPGYEYLDAELKDWRP
jgi:hypothetical protein